MNNINTNLQAMNAAFSLNTSQDMLNSSLQRLSSGSKIVNPADDAAGLAVADKFGAQNLRIQSATTNVQNALSYVQSADGYMSGMGTILTRMSELATLAQDPTKNASDIANYQQEFSALQDQLRSTIGGTTAEIGGTTGVTSPLGTFNGFALFGPSGATGAGLTVNIGPSSGQSMILQPTDLRQGSMLNVINQDNSGNYTLSLTDPAAVSGLSSALQQVATDRATVGAAQARLNLAASSLSVESQNLTSAISQISDVDVAKESTQYAKYNILVQAGTAMLAQANQMPQNVLRLLQK
jgi:flagellin